MFALLSLVLAAAPAVPPPPAAPPPEKDAVEPGKLTVLTDGKQHYLAFDPQGAYQGPAYYGDAKSLWRIRSYGGGASGTEQFNMVLWDPRVDRRNGAPSFDFKDGKYSVTCGDKTTDLVKASEAEHNDLRTKANFYKPRWTRRPYRLARDDAGTYYFVDCFRDERGGDCKVDGRDWRLWVGQRGKLKLQAMKNVVNDSVGEIFSSVAGDMRMVINANEPTPSDGPRQYKWVSGKSEKKLTVVPIEDNAVMVYTSLGVYDRERLGTPCDDLM